LCNRALLLSGEFGDLELELGGVVDLLAQQLFPQLSHGVLVCLGVFLSDAGIAQVCELRASDNPIDDGEVTEYLLDEELEVSRVCLVGLHFGVESVCEQAEFGVAAAQRFDRLVERADFVGQVQNGFVRIHLGSVMGRYVNFGLGQRNVLFGLLLFAESEIV